MMRFFYGSFLFLATQLFAQSLTYPDDYSTFFEEFISEQDRFINLTYPTSSEGSCGAVLPKPTIPPLAQVRPDANHIPIVLVNNTGLSDDQVYFTAYGFDGMLCKNGTSQSFVNFGTTPTGPFNSTGTLASPPSGVGKTSAYSYKFSDIPLSNGQRVIYVPPLNSGNILFSMGPLVLNTNTNSIAAPVPTDPHDPAYSTIYGAMEISFYPTSPSCSSLNQLTVDFSCVDFYGLSIYLNLYTANPLPNIPNNRHSGIYQSRSYTLCNLKRTFAKASPSALAQWQSLVIKEKGKTLRVVSPGYSMSRADAGGTFDINYFDNAAAYGFSWRDDIWNGTYYAVGKNSLTLTTNDGTVYIGNTSNGVFSFVATSGPGLNEVVRIPWTNTKSSGSFTTSTAIFNVATYFPEMSYSHDNGNTFCNAGTPGCPSSPEAIARLTEMTKFLSSAIAAGLIPGKISSLPPAGPPQSVIDAYYSPNTSLALPGSSTGPWYNLYSLGLLFNSTETGTVVYTYPYDDYLYGSSPNLSEVALGQASVDDTTYLTVILGPYSDN